MHRFVGSSLQNTTVNKFSLQNICVCEKVFVSLHPKFENVMNERQRLEQVIESEKMTAKQFAQEVGIQAGTISNILSGRNNPSLDVLQRVLNRFRTLSSDWLILGIGPMYRQNGAVVEQSLFDVRPDDSQAVIEAPQTQKTEQSPAPSQPMPVKLVDKILIFYTDGTFEER